jgi:hypothetical protein
MPPWVAEIFHPVSTAVDAIFEYGPIVAIPLIWLPMFLVLVAHEAGHALVAVFYKWPIREFRAYPFSIKKTTDGWKLHVSLNLWPGGLVVADPSRFAGFHSRLQVFALGGPLSNLATGILGWWMCLASRGSLLLAIEAIFVAWSFFTAFVNLLPLHLHGLELDGFVALIVSRSPQRLSARLAAFKMRDHLRNGKPLTTMNPRWVALAEGSGRVSLQSRIGAWLAYFYWMERKQVERAAGMLERLLRVSGDADVNFKAILFAECAVFAAHRGLKPAAQTWKDRASEFFLPEYLRRRCNSYVAFVERDFEVAYREAILAREAVLKLDDKTQKAFLPNWTPWIEGLDRARTLASEPVNA